MHLKHDIVQVNNTGKILPPKNPQNTIPKHNLRLHMIAWDHNPSFEFSSVESVEALFHPSSFPDRPTKAQATNRKIRVQRRELCYSAQLPWCRRCCDAGWGDPGSVCLLMMIIETNWYIYIYIYNYKYIYILIYNIYVYIQYLSIGPPVLSYLRDMIWSLLSSEMMQQIERARQRFEENLNPQDSKPAAQPTTTRTRINVYIYIILYYIYIYYRFTKHHNLIWVWVCLKMGYPF